MTKKIKIENIKWAYAPKKNKLPNKSVIYVSDDEYEKIKNGEYDIIQEKLKPLSGYEFEPCEFSIIYI